MNVLSFDGIGSMSSIDRAHKERKKHDAVKFAMRQGRDDPLFRQIPS